MKIIMILILSVGFPSFAGSGRSKIKPESLRITYEKSTNSKLVNVKGMVCDFCAQGLKKKFGQMKSVSSIEVNLESGNVLILLKKGMSLTDDVVKKAVNENGLEVIRISSK